MLRTRTAFLLLLAAGAADATHGDERASALSQFNHFDRDGSGYLSRDEMAACGCASFDRNGDLILMPAEYLQGRGVDPAAPAAPSGSVGTVRRTRAEFERYDVDRSGYLSRAEARACGCESLDANGDLIIMPAEFIARTEKASPAPSPRPSPRGTVSAGPAGTVGTGPQGGASGPWRAGDRVKAGCYGNMKEGVVDRVENGRAWVRFADEPNCDGFRDLDALQPAPREDHGAAGTSTGGAPPSGTYVCQKISGSSLIGLGNLEIRGNTYSGIGGGGSAPFTIDASGGITWTRGLRGLPDGWTVTSSRYEGLDYLGRPIVKIGYRTSRGSTDLIDCVRE